MPERPAVERTWSLVSYRPGDEHEILELFNTGFGQQRTMATWNWRFLANPYGGPFASLARRNSDGKLVGAYLCIPFQLAVDGQPELSFQGVDLIVSPECRKQGMFESMARHTYELLREAGGRALVAFPNPTAMSYPGFTRTLDWKPAAELKTYTRRLGLERPLRAMLKLPVLARAANAGFRAFTKRQLERELARRPEADNHATQFHMHTSVPPGCDELWDDCRAQQRLSFWKDSAYLRWRYDQDPDYDFEYACLTQAGRLIALAVVHHRDGVAVVCELLVAGRDVRTGRRLVAELCRAQFRARARSVSFLGHDAGFHTSILAGFSLSPVIHNVLVVRALEGAEPLERTMSQPDAWTLTYGDADFV